MKIVRCFYCKHYDDPCDQDGGLLEPCKSCIGYSNFTPRTSKL